MTEPVRRLVLPRSLRKVPNGKIPKEDLVRVKSGGVMYKTAAPAFNAMYDAAKKEGFVLKNIGDYRPYENQLKMFEDRYSLQRTGRKPVVKRKFLGKTWFLKKGKSPSATPGTSNHGWALAIDLGLATKTGRIASLRGNAKAFAWMCENAPRYGFYLAGPSKKLGKPNPEFEAWHWQYCLGDRIPPALRK